MGFFDFLGGVGNAIARPFQDFAGHVNSGTGAFSGLLNDEERKKEEERRKQVYDTENMSKKPGFFNFLGESLNELGRGTVKGVLATPAMQEQATGKLQKTLDTGKTEGILGTDIGSRKLSDQEKSYLSQVLENQKKGGQAQQTEVDLLSSIPGSIAQSALSVVPRVIGSVTGEDQFKTQGNDSKSEARRFFYGDNPAQNVGEYGRETASLVPGVKKENVPGWVAAPLGLALSVADLAVASPEGEGKSAAESISKGALEALSKADTAASVGKILKGTESLKSVPDDVAKAIAPQIAKLSDTESIQRLLGTVVQRSQAAIDTGKQTVGGANLGKIIPEDTQNLVKKVADTVQGNKQQVDSIISAADQHINDLTSQYHTAAAAGDEKGAKAIAQDLSKNYGFDVTKTEAMPQTTNLLTAGPEANPLTPGQAKQQLVRNGAADAREAAQSGVAPGQLQLPAVEDMLTQAPKTSNEIEFLNKQPARTKPIDLFSTVDEGRGVATRTTPSGATVPIRPGGGALTVPDIGSTENIKNISSSLKDPIMRIEQATKEGSPERQAAWDYLIKGHDENKAAYVADQQKYNDVVKTITDTLGIDTKKLSAAAQDLGEGKLPREDAVAKFGEQTVQNMEKANELARSVYEETLANVNKTRETWGKDAIPHREDYFRHFQEVGNSLKQLTGGLSEDAMGISKGKASIFNSAAKERKGGEYTSDLVGGLNDYLNSTLRETHFTDSIKRYESYADAVEAKSAAEGTNLTGFVNKLRDQAKAIGSQAVGFDVPLSQSDAGKKALNAMSWLQQRVGKNTIIGNMSSALSQTLGWAGAPAEVGTKNTFLGALDNLAALTKKGEDVIDKSPFLKERYFDQAGIKGIGQKLEGVAAKPFEIIEKASTDAIWRSSYRKALDEGLKGTEAIRQADTYTKKIVGARGIGDKAIAFESKTGNAALQFQLEVNNLYQRYMKEAAGIGGYSKMDPKKMATFAVTTYLMNSAFEGLTGRRPLPDFINAGIETGQDIAKGDYSAAAGRIPGEILGNAPGGQTLASFLPDDVRKKYLGSTDVGRYSGSIPIAQAVQDAAGVVTNPAQAVSKTLANVAAPFAGKPSQRFLKAGVDNARGYTETDKGQVKYQTGGFGDFIRQALFGENATPGGRDYYKNQLKPLSDQQSAFVKNVVEQQKSNPDKQQAANIVESTMQYYQTRQKAAQKANYKKYSDQITEALGTGNDAKAQQLAQEYNTKVTEAFKDYGDKYAQYALPEIQKDYGTLFINLNKQSVRSRMKSYAQTH